MDHTSAPSVRPFILAWCICLTIMELIGVGFARDQSHGALDFRSFYSAGYQVRTHPLQLYDLRQEALIQTSTAPNERGVLPYYHLPYEALMYAPFSYLSYRTAYLAFIAFNMLLLMAAFFAARPMFSSVIPWWQPRPGLMFFVYVPLIAAMIQGQDSILFLLLCCLALRQMESGQDASAGCLLALALFKFQLALPIAALIAMRRGWRFSLGFLLTAVAVGLSCFSIVGRAGMASLIRLLTNTTSVTEGNALSLHRAGIYPAAMPNLSGFLYACGTRGLPPHLAFIVVAACSLGLFIWCARMVRRGEQNVAFSIAVLCGLLVSYHLYIYDLTLALLPAALLAERTKRYLLLALFSLPIALLVLGSKSWLVLLALPVLAMLINAIASLRAPIAAAPETAHATPAELEAA